MSSPPDLHQRADYRDFMVEIARRPLDDDLRLVFSDWLEDHGDIDHARFIRIQIERASLRKEEPRSIILSYEEKALLHRHRRRWAAALPEWLRSRVRFERGLPGRVALKAAEFLEHAGDDWAAIPVHELELQDVGSLWHDLLACDQLARLTLLDLHNGRLGDSGVAALAASPRLACLRDLGLFGNGIGVVGACALAGSDSLPALTHLRLGDNPLGRAGIEALTATEFLASVTLLSLVVCPLDTAAIRALLAGPLDHLESLDLSMIRRRMDIAGVEAIANCPRLRNLTDLNLRYSLTCDEQVQILAASPYLLNLRDLILTFSDDTEGLEGLRALACSRSCGMSSVSTPGSTRWVTRPCASWPGHLCSPTSRNST
jgi:uncharacterized protein (TIGR02996 family)